MSINTLYLSFGNVDATDFIGEVNVSGISKQDIVGLLNNYGVIKSGHFVLLSGLHTPHFVQFNLLADTLRLSKILAGQFSHERIDVVLTPDTSGIRLAGGIADARNADLLIAPVGNDSYPAQGHEDYVDLSNKNVLIVVDIITSGKGLQHLLDICKKYSGVPVGIGAFINRGYKTMEQLRKETSFENISVICTGNFIHYEKDACPLCAKKIEPIFLSKDLNLAISSEDIRRYKSVA